MKTVKVILFLVVTIASCQSEGEKGKAPSVAKLPSESELRSFVRNESKHTTDQRMKQLDSLLIQTGTDSMAFHKMAGYLEQPLGNPNSPYRNEDLYIQLLQAKLKSPWSDSLQQTLLRDKLFLLMQNRPGDPANDFSYITPAGPKERMYDIKAEFLLLFFYNPECEACKEMKAAINNSSLLNEQQQNGRLRVLAVYTDRDQSVWRRHLLENPEAWINGRDEDEYLYKYKIYNLQAIPTLYLLDRDKRVLLKDCTEIGELEKKISGAE